MTKRSGLTAAAFAIVVLTFYLGYSYNQREPDDQKLIQKIMERKQYSLVKKEKVPIRIFVKPEWISLNNEERRIFNKELMESHGTHILLQDVRKRENDVYFSFHTTFDVKPKKGEFLSNILVYEDGSYSQSGSFDDLKLSDPAGREIPIGQTGSGPGSDFSFGIQTSDADRIKDGFVVEYLGFIRYEYVRK